MKASKIKENARDQVASEKRKLEQLKEQRNFFKIRFQTLLESHLEMLSEEENDSLRGESNSSDFKTESQNDEDRDYE